ncbi:DUF6907 domain-containing protein [Streptomyces sp. NPDC006530]|uniref:DUF6907 domain-containing protein n=1 Tax=Streptomyces sp. NPDC006530 TaxID=3364750 RepID=UPI00368D0463
MSLYETIMAGVVCPDWCNGDHSDFNIKSTDDVFHMSDSAALYPATPCPLELVFTALCDSLPDGSPGPPYIEVSTGQNGSQPVKSVGSLEAWQASLRALADDLEPLKAIVAARQPVST